MTDNDATLSLEDQLEALKEAHKRERDALKQRRDREREALKQESDRRRESLKAEADALKQEQGRNAEELKRERDRQREAHKAERDRRRDATKEQRDAIKEQREALKDERDRLKDARKAVRDRLPGEVAVLWRDDDPGSRRGPRPGLTHDDIADAGIAIADAEGLDAVSMARVADKLGYTAMSLYRYVASKDELVSLMLDRASGEPPATDSAAGWRARLETLLRAQMPILLRHPWTLSTPLLFNAMGPHRLAWWDAMLASLAGTDLPPERRLAISGALANQAVADARAYTAIAAQARRSAEVGDIVGFQATVAAIADPQRFPALAGTIAEASSERSPDTPADALTPGLVLLLDGVAAWIAGVEPPTAPPPVAREPVTG